MARAGGVDPKLFRRALRQAGLAWHRHGERWTVEIGSARHKDMQDVLDRLLDSRDALSVRAR